MGIRSQNNPAASYLDKWVATSTDAMTPSASYGHEASGGTISEYSDGTKTWRSHTFINSGTFNISKLGSYSANVELLLVAGGGGGGGTGGPGNYAGGGGGAGSLHYKQGVPVSVSPGEYTIVIGAGGRGSRESSDTGSDGNDSTAFSVTADGGGYGGSPG